MTDQAELHFWFNSKTGAVEHGPQDLALNRIGPFATRIEAERALELIKERAEKIAQEEDADWPKGS